MKQSFMGIVSLTMEILASILTKFIEAYRAAFAQ